MLRVNIKTRASYYDRADTSDRIFYIYNLARYNNRPHYHYGETCDLHYTEFALKAKVPIYTRICYYPIDAATDGLARFERIIAPKRTSLPALPVPNVFALDDATEMEGILAGVDAIFGVSADAI